jgi:hypothetical protein
MLAAKRVRGKSDFSFSTASKWWALSESEPPKKSEELLGSTLDSSTYWGTTYVPKVDSFEEWKE